MNRLRCGLGALFLLIGLLAAPDAIDAQTPADTRATAAADAAIAQLRSPYCPGRMLENCTSSAAGALRDSIHDLASQGASTEELVEWMLARHGEEYRGVPQGRGFGLFAWVIPPIAVLAAAAFVVLWFRSRRLPSGGTSTRPPSAISEAERRELADAMRVWESSGDSGR